MTKDDDRIVYGGPVPVNFHKGAKSLGEYCMVKLIENGDRDLFINGLTDERLTASQLLARSIRVAECLQHYGIKSGDIIGLCSENRFEVADIVFGAFYVGAAIALFNPTYSERELEHVIQLSKPTIIFASSNVEAKLRSSIRQIGFIRETFIFDANYNSDFIQNERIRRSNRYVCEPQNVKELNAVIYTSSGTTGLPKGVQITQLNILAALVVDAHFDPLDIWLTIPPWTHIYGCAAMLRSVMATNITVVLPKYSETNLFNCIQKYKVRTMVLVPSIMVLLAKSPLVNNYDISSLKTVVSSSAPLTKETEDAVKRRTNIENIRQRYGMSETMGLIAQTDTHHKAGSVGILRTGVWAKVVDDDGRLLEANETGELLFKSDSIMKGYLGDAEATAHTIDADGWLHTGDIGYYDEDREFFIVDRLKELIKYKGYQVPPAELESLLLTHPNVQDAGVIGVPDEAAGELPLAFVVRSGTVTEREIIDFVAARTSSAKQLRGGVRFISALPKNGTGKILRRVLRDMAKNTKSKL